MVLRRAAEAVKQAVDASLLESRTSFYPPEAPARAPLRPEPTPTDEQRPTRPRPTTPDPLTSRSAKIRRAEIVATLASLVGVRQALVLQEILGPPKALQDWEH